MNLLPVKIKPKWFRYAFFSWLLLAFSSNAAEPVANLFSVNNNLANHPSPYLALHGKDPVNWQDWNQETVQLARESNRLILLSIGYFSCHWCHVMQRESYQNEAIANTLNQHFVSVKIDRELEPALDSRLIDFAERTLGRAGWPLNVFVTPDGFPFFAVLYMPAAQFGEVLNRVIDVWSGQSEQVQELARQVNQHNYVPAEISVNLEQIQNLVEQLVNQSLQFHDDFQGGFGNQNKFPHAPELSDLLDIYEFSKVTLLHDLLVSSLDAMAGQGLWDHVGGGFFRYVVDPDWHIPHFEKMLYDNALLASVYLKAGRLFPESDYTSVAIQTLDFLINTMQSEQGAFYASFSAVDDKDTEGGYYLWDDQELEALLQPDELRILKTRCQVRGVPFGAGHHLRCSESLVHVATNLTLDIEDANKVFQRSIKKLKDARQQRTLPTDNKLLAGWNGLALAAFSDAARQLNLPRYREAAKQVRDYLAMQLWDGRVLSRARAGDQSLGSVSLEDYAFVADGFWRYAKLNGKKEDFDLAQLVLGTGFELFWRDNSWQLASNSLLGAEPRYDLITDSPLPSPSALMGSLAIQVAEYYKDDMWLELSTQVLNRSHEKMAENAFFYSSHITALRRLAVVLTGESK